MGAIEYDFVPEKGFCSGLLGEFDEKSIAIKKNSSRTRVSNKLGDFDLESINSSDYGYLVEMKYPMNSAIYCFGVALIYRKRTVLLCK